MEDEEDESIQSASVRVSTSSHHRTHLVLLRGVSVGSVTMSHLEGFSNRVPHVSLLDLDRPGGLERQQRARVSFASAMSTADKRCTCTIPT